MKVIRFAIIAATLSTSTLWAQPPPNGGPGQRGHRPPPAPLFELFDSNQDGVIDRTEITNAPTVLKTLSDKTGGLLTLEDLLPAPPANGKANRPKHPVPPLFAVLDANGDGSLDRDEMANASTALTTLDRNGDGQLTKDEVRPDGGPGAPPPPPPPASNT